MEEKQYHSVFLLINLSVYLVFLRVSVFQRLRNLLFVCRHRVIRFGDIVLQNSRVFVHSHNPFSEMGDGFAHADCGARKTEFVHAENVLIIVTLT